MKEIKWRTRWCISSDQTMQAQISNTFRRSMPPDPLRIVWRLRHKKQRTLEPLVQFAASISRLALETLKLESSACHVKAENERFAAEGCRIVVRSSNLKVSRRHLADYRKICTNTCAAIIFFHLTNQIIDLWRGRWRFLKCPRGQKSILIFLWISKLC